MTGYSSSVILCEPQRKEEINHSEVVVTSICAVISLQPIQMSLGEIQDVRRILTELHSTSHYSKVSEKKEPCQLLLFKRKQLERRKTINDFLPYGNI